MWHKGRFSNVYNSKTNPYIYSLELSIKPNEPCLDVIKRLKMFEFKFYVKHFHTFGEMCDSWLNWAWGQSVTWGAQLVPERAHACPHVCPRVCPPVRLAQSKRPPSLVLSWIDVFVLTVKVIKCQMSILIPTMGVFSVLYISTFIHANVKIKRTFFLLDF